jgi:hypothetical protein
MFEVERNRTENVNGDWDEYKCNQDENGIYKEYVNSSGYWWKSVSDVNNNLLSYENSDGVWEQLTYNEKGHVLTYRYSTGFDVKYDYYGNCNDCLMTTFKLEPGRGYFTKEQFDSEEKKLINKITMTNYSVKTENPDGEWEEYTYDENGEEISYYSSDRYTESFLS